MGWTISGPAALILREYGDLRMRQQLPIEEQ